MVSQQFALAKMYVLKIGSVVTRGLQTHLLELGSYVIGGQLKSSRARTSAFHSIVGKEFHVGAKRIRPNLLQEFLRRERGRAILRVGKREEQKKAQKCANTLVCQGQASGRTRYLQCHCVDQLFGCLSRFFW